MEQKKKVPFEQVRGMPPELRRQLTIEAAKRVQSKSSLIIQILQEWVDANVTAK